MKALNVLNESKRAICIFIDSLLTKKAKKDDEYTSSIKYLEEINEAIKELEDLENRSCENCKFKYVVDSMCTECRCNESPIDYIDFDCFPFFSCSEWEPK